MPKPFHKRPAKLLAVLLCAAAALAAQDSQKITVPLHDPSRPAKIQIHLSQGGIKVRGADVKEITVEAHEGTGRKRRESRPDRSDGMKRLELPGNAGLDIVEDNNQVTIRTSMMGSGGDILLTVPRHSSLNLKCMNGGDIEVEQVDGEIDVDNMNGKVILRNVAGSVLAHSMNGSVTAVLDRVDAAKPMSFSTMNGDIDVTLPPDLKANVRMKADNGDIFSDFEVNLNSSTNVKPTEAGRQPDGTYRVRFDKALRGSINGGGPEYLFTSFNGQIYIRKKK